MEDRLHPMRRSSSAWRTARTRSTISTTASQPGRAATARRNGCSIIVPSSTCGMASRCTSSVVHADSLSLRATRRRSRDSLGVVTQGTSSGTRIPPDNVTWVYLIGGQLRVFTFMGHLALGLNNPSTMILYKPPNLDVLQQLAALSSSYARLAGATQWNAFSSNRHACPASCDRWYRDVVRQQRERRRGGGHHRHLPAPLLEADRRQRSSLPRWASPVPVPANCSRCIAVRTRASSTGRAGAGRQQRGAVPGAAAAGGHRQPDRRGGADRYRPDDPRDSPVDAQPQRLDLVPHEAAAQARLEGGAAVGRAG